MTSSEPLDTTPDPARCPSCRNEVTSGARFCHGCGAALPTDGDTDGRAGHDDDVRADAVSEDVPAQAHDAAGDTAIDDDTDDDTTASEDGDADEDGDDEHGDADEESARTVEDHAHDTAVIDRPVEVAQARVVPADAVACRACGAPNAADRDLCGACGADLATGETGLSVEPLVGAGNTFALAGSGSRRAARRWWLPVLAVVAVIAGVVGALAWLELGPFAEPDEIPPVAFAPERYTDDPDTLALTDVATLTMRAPDGDRTFTPERMVDGDPFSSWHGDAASLPPGTDEKVDLFLEEPSWVTAVILANGDHLEPDAYADAARIQRVELVFDGDVRVAATLLDQGLESQIVELPEPLLTTAVRIEIVESVPGLEREDVALSRVELVGNVADEQDAEVAEERADVRPAAGAIALPSS